MVENGMKINPGKSKATRLTRARVKNPLGYSLGDQKIPEVSSCKYFGILRSYLNWVDQVTYIVHTKDYDWETLAQGRIARLCAFFKAYSGERA